MHKVSWWMAAPLLAWTVLFQPAQAQPSPIAETGAAPAAAALDSQAALNQARLVYEVLLGELSLRAGDPASGAVLMMAAARRSDDDDIYRRAMEIALASRSGPFALDAVREWLRSKPGSVPAKRLELQIQLAMGQAHSTESGLREMLASLPTHDRLALLEALPSIYSRVADKKLAADVVQRALDAALQQPDTAAAAWTAIGRMRLLADDLPAALDAAVRGHQLERAAEGPPRLALALMQQPSTAAPAEALVRDYLTQPNHQPEIDLGFVGELVRNRPENLPDAHQLLSNLTRHRPDYAEGWLVQGLMQTIDRHDAQALDSLNRYLERARANSAIDGLDRTPGLDQAYLALAALAERRGDWPAALNWLQRVQAPDQADTAQARRAELLAQLGRIDEARQAIHAISASDAPSRLKRLRAEARLLREHEQPHEAYQLLMEELAKTPDDEDLLFETALAAKKMGDVPEMERLLRRHIELNPKSPHPYNLLGFALADRNLRLAEAKQLIETALTLKPESAYFQDSLGWVEFRLGRHTQALNTLQAAYQREPDAEIGAHLGEVLWTLGQRDRALAIWRQARQREPAHPTLVETLRRLRVKL